MAKRIAISSGSPDPLGVTHLDVGVNVAVVSRHAERIEFCVFDERDVEIARLPLPDRVGDVFCGFVTGVGAGALYGLRADGPYAPERGQWFDPSKLLVDPYARALDRPFAYHADLAAPRSAAIDTAPRMPKGLVAVASAPVTTSKVRRAPDFIYEVSVGAFTKLHPAVPEGMRGTVAALAHPAVLDHLVKLGVDAVELMPLVAWIDERHLQPLGLTNAWGYNPVAFMVPDPRLAPGGIAEIRDTVAALHAAGIGVILDAVYNHTGESDALGPTLSLRGLDNTLYYRHAPDDPGRLANDTGTGNVLAADRPEVAALILDSMRHWATATGIDGFRLDLASALGRSDDGFHSDAPLFKAIEADPVLGKLTMIAEPWDVGLGGYQLGKFPARWREWNDRYRDDVRRFWQGDVSALGALATRLSGSQDTFGQRRPSASVNFIAAHDGFTMADLLAFRDKHNEANGEGNRDGGNANFSWNNGVEGVSHDADIVARRQRDVRALLATLFTSRGSLMLTAGDEFGRSQAGNNNAYAQDNAVTWLDWTHADSGLAAFTGRLAALRKQHPSLADDRFLTGLKSSDTRVADAVWLNPNGGEMRSEDWSSGRAVGLVRTVPADDGTPTDTTAVWINGGDTPVATWLPAPHPGARWTMELDSGRPDAKPEAFTGSYSIAPRSVVVFAEAV